MGRFPLRFSLIATDPSGARRGLVVTPRGEVNTPAFMPVGTQGAVKAVTPAQVLETGAEVVLANTYHLSWGGRRELVKRAGGLHRFMGWPLTVLPDSGGFQVFSLPDAEVSDQGVSFSPGDRESMLTPETAMEIQRDLGADIVMCLDQCVGYPATREEIEESVERTTLWAKRCLDVPLQKHQSPFAIVQGGVFPDLRSVSASQLVELDFPGYAVGGVSVGEGLEMLKRVLDVTSPLLPSKKPRYLMGVGLPEDILESIERGMDMFDCVIPTRYARGGTLFTRMGKIRVMDKRYRKDQYPPDTHCSCYTCRNFSRMYLRHLFFAKEPLAETLATIHNLAFYQEMMSQARQAIVEGRFGEFKRGWLERMRSRRRRGEKR